MTQFKIILLLLLSWPAFSQKDSNGSFSTKITVSKQLNYALHTPAGAGKQNKKPLIVFLHGSGEKGNDIEKVKAHGPFKYLKNNAIDAYVLAPQCPENEYWDSETLHRLVLDVIKNNNIDPQRVYLTGLSMGGWGAWNLAFAYPDTFAAFVVVAGFVDRVPMIENCKISNMPIRIFHGLMDDVVDVGYSVAIYKKLKPCANDIELTIFDDANHDSWTRVYDDPAIYEWMLKQKK